MPYHPGTEAYEDAIFAAVEAVILLTAAILLPWFFRRRDKHPIKGRLPFLVIITNSVLQLWGLSVALIRILITQFPCAVAIVNSHIILLSAVDTMVLRLWVFHFAYNATSAMAEVPMQMKRVETFRSAEAAASANPIKNWYLLNKHRVAPRYLAGLVALSFSIRCITPIVLYATMDDISAPVGSDDCSFIVADAVSNGILIFFALIFFFLSRNMNTLVDDAYSIKREFRYTAWVTVVGVVLNSCFNNIPKLKDINRDSFGVSGMIAMLCVHCIALITLGYPIWMSYRFESRTPIKDLELIDSNTDSLLKVLKLPEGEEAFRAFLVSEFSVENLLFWEEINFFRSSFESIDQDGSTNPGSRASVAHSPPSEHGYGQLLTPPESSGPSSPPSLSVKGPDWKRNSPSGAAGGGDRVGIREAALYLYEKYVKPLAPLQVNLPFRISRPIAQALGFEQADKPDESISSASSSNLTLTELIVQTGAASDENEVSESGGKITVSPHMFNAAQACIFALMQTDSFPRFCRSEEFAKLVRAAKKRSHTNEVVELVEK